MRKLALIRDLQHKQQNYPVFLTGIGSRESLGTCVVCVVTPHKLLRNLYRKHDAEGEL